MSGPCLLSHDRSESHVLTPRCRFWRREVNTAAQSRENCSCLAMWPVLRAPPPPTFIEFSSSDNFACSTAFRSLHDTKAFTR